jgi:hypothetical protein
MKRAEGTMRRRFARSGFAGAHRPPVRLASALACVAFCAGTASALAQEFGPPPGVPSAQPPRAAAVFDITGNWVSIVNEDWRWRMVTPPKGDYESLTMLNREGRAVADAWDPATDGSCKAYGAPGLLRMPTRLRIRWASDTELALETDAGRQLRRLRFSEPAATAEPPGPPSRQGVSTAQWQRPPRPVGGVVGFPVGPPPSGGSLKVTTTNLLPGWLRRNGVPYSDRTSMTEYFNIFESPNGDAWLIVTTVVEDPVYFSGRYVTSSHFKREPDDSNWNPTDCRSE